MRQMQIQQDQAIAETFKTHLFKQAPDDATGVNVFDARQSSNAETQHA